MTVRDQIILMLRGLTSIFVLMVLTVGAMRWTDNLGVSSLVQYLLTAMVWACAAFAAGFLTVGVERG